MSLRGGYFIVDMSPLPPIKKGRSNAIKTPAAFDLINNMIKSKQRVFLLSGLRLYSTYGEFVEQDRWCSSAEVNLTNVDGTTNDTEFRIPVKNVWEPNSNGESTITTYVLCFDSTSGIYYADITHNYKDYTDYQNEFLKTDGQNSMLANLNVNTHKVVNLANPTAASDAANKKYVDDTIRTKLSAYSQWFCAESPGEVGSLRVKFTLTPNGAITTTELANFPSLASSVQLELPKEHWDIIKAYNNITSDTDFSYSYFIVYKLNSSESEANNVGQADHKFLSSPLISTTSGLNNGWEQGTLTFDILGSISGGNPYNATSFYLGIKFGKRIII